MKRITYPAFILSLFLVAQFVSGTDLKSHARDSKVRRSQYVAPLYPLFLWPKELTSEDALRNAVIGYATQVGTCGSINPASMNAGQQDWLESREEVMGGAAKLSANLRNFGADIKARRDEFCSYVRTHFIERTFRGGECQQYGNCGDAAHVNYCLAHFSGLTSIKFCVSSWEHIFTVAKNRKEELCVMDRWHLRGTNTDDDFYFCGRHVGIENGVVMIPDNSKSPPVKPSTHKWYSNVSCYDPLETPLRKPPKPTSDSSEKGTKFSRPVVQTNLSLDRWDESKSWGPEKIKLEADKVDAWNKTADATPPNPQELKAMRDDEAQLQKARKRIESKAQ